MQDLIIGETYSAYNPSSGWKADVVYKYKVDDDASFMAHGVLFLEDVPGTHLVAGTVKELGNLIQFKLKHPINLENK